MAKYWEDWSGFSTGNITGNPTGWTKRWATATASLSIVSDVDAPAGKALRVAKSASDRFAMTFNGTDSDVNRANCEVRVLFRTPAAVYDGLNVFGVVGRGSGAAAAETAYVANVFCLTESGTVYRRARVTEYNAGTATGNQGLNPALTNAWDANTLYWLRMSCQGTTILWGIAPASDPTSEITGGLTDSSITAAGWLGFFVFGVSGYSVNVLAVGFGTNGDAAPITAPDTTAPTLSSPTSSATGATSGSGGVTTNEGSGALYAVATTSATAPTKAQVKAGQTHTGAAAPWAGNQAVSSTGAKSVTVTGLSASTAYYLHFMHEDSSANQSDVATSASFTTDTPDTTAPTLTGASATATGSTAATGSVSTNEATGTLYFVTSANASESATTVKAGSSQPVTSTGTQSVSVTGLTAATAYYLHFVHRDAAGNDSAVASSAQFTTSTAPLEITIRDDYERSSVNLSGSSVSGLGDDAIVTIKPRLQKSEIVGGQSRWFEPSARVDGVTGYRPTFIFTDYAATASEGKYHGAPWGSTRRPMFSYDRETWHYFDNCTVGASSLTFRHNTTFTSDTVYIGKGRQVSVTQIGEWLEDMAAAYPTLFKPTPTAESFTPTLTSWPAQSFIADEYSPTTDEMGNAIPATPFYAAVIDDGGPLKTKAVMSCGVHAGEDHGDIVGMKTVEYLLGSSQAAVDLRSRYRIFVYPMINAPARYGGGWRGAFQVGNSGADDANRNFNSTTSGLEIVDIPKAVMAADLGTSGLGWGIDFHGQFYGTWTEYSPDTTNNVAFRQRLTAASGVAFGTAGQQVVGGVSSHYAGMGGALVMTFESGDARPVPDSEITAYASYIVGVLDSMADDKLIPWTANPEIPLSLSNTAPAKLQGFVATSNLSITNQELKDLLDGV